MRILITGDRAAFVPAALPVVSIEIMKALAQANDNDEKLTIVTGDFPGVELAVRAVCKAAGAPLEVMPETPRVDGPESKFDLAARTLYTCALGVDKILVVHPDPHSSSIYKALIAVPALEPLVELVHPDVVLTVE